MNRHALERKEAVCRQLLSPECVPLPQLAKETGIGESTLYTWRLKLRQTTGAPVPKSGKSIKHWSSAEKFAVVLEAAPLNATELAEYARRKGLYVEHIQAWTAACRQANGTLLERPEALREQTRLDKKRIQELERELRRKEKALAEAAALLVLRKKAQAIWGEDEDA